MSRCISTGIEDVPHLWCRLNHIGTQLTSTRDILQHFRCYRGHRYAFSSERCPTPRYYRVRFSHIAIGKKSTRVSFGDVGGYLRALSVPIQRPDAHSLRNSRSSSNYLRGPVLLCSVQLHYVCNYFWKFHYHSFYI